MVWQTVNGSQGVAESCMSHITPVGIVLFDELLTLIDQIQPLGQLASTVGMENDKDRNEIDYGKKFVQKFAKNLQKKKKSTKNK